MAFLKKKNIFAKKFHCASFIETFVWDLNSSNSGGNEPVFSPTQKSACSTREREEWRKKNSKNFIKVKKHELLNSRARRWRTLESHKRHQNNIKWNVLKYIWSSFVYFTQMRPREASYVIYTHIRFYWIPFLCSSERFKVAFDNYFTLNSNVSDANELWGYEKNF